MENQDMIYILSARNRKRKGSSWYHSEAPHATIFVVQRPFSFLSVGPIIPYEHEDGSEKAIQDYRRWLFGRLMSHKPTIQEFTKILDALIQEGDIILQCSCNTNMKTCHANVIKDALEWAERFGIDDWRNQLKASKSRSR